MIKERAMADDTMDTYWQSHYVSWQQSGVKQSDYCQINDLELSQFKRHNKRLLKQGLVTSKRPTGRRSVKPDFVPIGLPEQRLANKLTEVELQLPAGIGLTIRITG